MEPTTVIGLVAATFTTVSLFPQLVKSWKSRRRPAGDASLVVYSVLFCIGIFLWLVYGLLLFDLPIIVANSLSFTQGLIILIIQLRRLQNAKQLSFKQALPQGKTAENKVQV
ncbi:MAG: SemiSWEET transporter [Candidatus Bathyarchaeia archaeon]|jgi:MtN3 and saliva related transmembrane protein